MIVSLRQNNLRDEIVEHISSDNCDHAIKDGPHLMSPTTTNEKPDKSPYRILCTPIVGCVLSSNVGGLIAKCHGVFEVRKQLDRLLIWPARNKPNEEPPGQMRSPEPKK